MRRGNRKDPAEYIRIRMTQLYAEREKCSDPYDAQWYNRCAEELYWVLKLMEKEEMLTFLPKEETDGTS